jgi:membrane protease YdiL (CAAX protease family)
MSRNLIEGQKVDQGQIEKHTTAQSVFLHLVPGVLVGSFYFLALKPVASMGYPSFFALLLAFAFILIPLELGFLLYQGKKKTGQFTLRGIVSYQNPIPWWQYLVWGCIIFGIVGAIMTLLKPVDTLLQKHLFFWMPDMDLGLDGHYSKKILIVTYSVALLINVFLAPMVEELYFRGYLLPRMKGKSAIFFHSLLFAAIHVFTPWMIIARTVGFLPIILGTTKKNLYLGMVVHMLCNATGFVTGIGYISKMA